MEKANKRIKVLEHDLNKLAVAKMSVKENDDSDDDDDLDDSEALKAELEELKKENKARQEKIDEYEKNKKWNVDNMFHVKEERTLVNPSAAETGYTPSGFIRPKEDDVVAKKSKPKDDEKRAPASAKPSKEAASKPAAAAPTKTAPAGPMTPSRPQPSAEDVAMESYPEFTKKYANVVEQFMAIPDLAGSKEFLLQNANILLQENASNYLLLASLEDEMNGEREKMKRTARQSQIISHIAELAKTLSTHPGNVIQPFFVRLGQREHLQDFLQQCNDFVDKIIQRAIVKKHEMDAAAAAEQAKDLEDIPREQRLGPGGLDPLEVIETLPKEMVEAFESREVQALHDALMKLDPKDAEYHMKRCIDSGLWVANANEES